MTRGTCHRDTIELTPTQRQTIMYTQITTPKTVLPQCSLNLMPFRINYSGRAALQTFFRVKPLEGTIHEGETQNTPDATVTHTSTKNPVSSLGARFAAAFRGRAMKGVTVNLPEGYEGIVLRVDEERANDRMKRGRRRRKAEVDEDVDMEEGTDEEEEERRTFKPTGQFSSFVLWSPDLPVDPSRDEYLRSLTEWTKLAAEVSLLIY